MRVNIEAERARLQMTKSELAAALGVTLKTYNSYINGETIPSGALVRLAELSGRSTDYLLGLKAPSEA